MFVFCADKQCRLRYNEIVTSNMISMSASRSTISFARLLRKKEEEFILNELAHYENTGESYSFEETLFNA